MLEKLLVTASRCGQAPENLKNWYESGKATKTRVFKTAIMLAAIILVVETHSAIIGLIMLHLPRLTALVVLICAVAPVVVILLTPVLLVIELATTVSEKIKTFNAGLWITALMLSLLLWIINFGLWWFGGIGLTRIPLLIRTLFHQSTTQFPLGELSGIAVDAKGNVYLASPAYERIQVYTNQGKFSRGCFVDVLVSCPIICFGFDVEC